MNVRASLSALLIKLRRISKKIVGNRIPRKAAGEIPRPIALRELVLALGAVHPVKTRFNGVFSLHPTPVFGQCRFKVGSMDQRLGLSHADGGVAARESNIGKPV